MQRRPRGATSVYLCSAMRPNTDPVRTATHKHKDSESPRDRDRFSDRPGYGIMLFRVAGGRGGRGPWRASLLPLRRERVDNFKTARKPAERVYRPHGRSLTRFYAYHKTSVYTVSGQVERWDSYAKLGRGDFPSSRFDTRWLFCVFCVFRKRLRHHIGGGSERCVAK